MVNIVQSLGSRSPTPTSNYNVTFVIAECPLCGKHFEAQMRSLRSGHTKSCGCAKFDGSSRQTTKILRDQNPRLYRIWKNMRTRCNNPNIPQATNYSLRGISVCPEWNDYKTFFSWAMSNGYSDELSIDRIDVNGNYNPTNCRWATHKDQLKNTQLLRSTNKTGFRGVTTKGVKFIARATNHVSDRRVFLGYFDSAEDAAIAYDHYVTENNLGYPLNFGDKK